MRWRSRRPCSACRPRFGATLSSTLYYQAFARSCARMFPYTPHSPWGGDMPFVANEGISHYYGVSAHRSLVEEARRAGVRFSAESLGFANLPDVAPLHARAGYAGDGPARPSRTPAARRRRDLGVRGDPQPLHRGALRDRRRRDAARGSGALRSLRPRDERGDHGGHLRGMETSRIDDTRRPSSGSYAICCPAPAGA